MHGYQHTAINLACTASACGLLALLDRSGLAWPIGAGMVFGTLLVTPDLDLPYNDARRHWGPLKFIWDPYAAACTHRGINHTYLIGPLMRLLYLGIIFGPPTYLSIKLLSAISNLNFPEISPALATAAFLGYLLAQWLHLLCDGILPFSPRGRRRRAGRVRPE